MAAAQQAARRGLARLFLGIDSATDPQAAQDAGAFYYALLAKVMTQWLIDPALLRRRSELANGLRIISSGEIGVDPSEGLTARTPGATSRRAPASAAAAAKP